MSGPITKHHVIKKFRQFSSLKRFKLDERKSPKYLDDVADCYSSTHNKDITIAISDPDLSTNLMPLN